MSTTGNMDMDRDPVPEHSYQPVKNETNNELNHSPSSHYSLANQDNDGQSSVGERLTSKDNTNDGDDHMDTTDPSSINQSSTSQKNDSPDVTKTSHSDEQVDLNNVHLPSHDNHFEHSDNNDNEHSDRVETQSGDSLEGRKSFSLNETNQEDHSENNNSSHLNSDPNNLNHPTCGRTESAEKPPSLPPPPEYDPADWYKLQFHHQNQQTIRRPHEIGKDMKVPEGQVDEQLLDQIQGSMIGMAVGDALGAHVEFRPHEYLVNNEVTDLGSGGTWGLQKGQFTDDTSMALCLANSLVACHDYNPYDQLVRYKWWYRYGYMSSTGHCFDIGAATSNSLREFERRQKQFSKEHKIPLKDMDSLTDRDILKDFDVYCSDDGVAGNGALMRLAPVPLFFCKYPAAAIELSGCSGQITHGDKKAYDSCRYYGALIVAALHKQTKIQLLDDHFYTTNKALFGDTPLHPDVLRIAEGSYKKKGGYAEGIRGKGYIVNALEAALWAFWSDDDSFEKGALAAVNLGDDTDTTAAIYGQLAGAYYGYKNLPAHWVEHVYAKDYLEKLSQWIAYEGDLWQRSNQASASQT